MFSGTSAHPRPRHGGRAFTLLEVMLAVMILGLIAVSLYRFVTTSLTAITYSMDDTAHKREVAALVSVLQSEFSRLTYSQAGAQQTGLLGQPHKFSDRSRDEIQWFTQAGNGLFTEAAQGPWKVTLLLRAAEHGGGYVLGLTRELPTNTSKDEEHWLPLLRNVDAIEVRYFVYALNRWGDRADQGSPPDLVRIRIWRSNETNPYEAVLPMPLRKFPTS